jgi:hypothetical protein
MDKQLTLEEYASLDETELGEVCELLISLQKYSYMISTNLNEALNKEIKEQHEYFIENTKIVEHKETCIKRWKELEWNE